MMSKKAMTCSEEKRTKDGGSTFSGSSWLAAEEAAAVGDTGPYAPAMMQKGHSGEKSCRDEERSEEPSTDVVVASSRTR